MSKREVVLVTGGAGFIGSCLVRQLLAETDYFVVNLDKLTYAGHPESIPAADAARYELVQGDIADATLVARLLGDFGPKWVVNLAAESHVDRSIDGPDDFIQTNVVGTFRLLEAVRAWWRELDPAGRAEFRLLHVSTEEVYGSLGSDGRFDEHSRYAPNSPYSASKAASDHFVRAWHRTFGLPVLTVNCSNNYGPYQYPEKLIPLITLNALEGRPLPVYGDGSHIRDWLYVDDNCRAMRAVLERGTVGEVYNVGGNSERSNLDLVRMICDLVDEMRPAGRSRRELISFVDDRPGHDRRYATDCSRLSNELGWQALESFESGLRKTVAWYLANPAWIDLVTADGYRRERLGLGS